MIDVGATGKIGLVGWLVEGDGRYLRTVEGTGNAHGLALIGNGNTIDNGRAEKNAGLGIYVDGQNNSVIGSEVVSNGDIGIFLKGSSNRLAGNAVGERDRGNGHAGIHARVPAPHRGEHRARQRGERHRGLRRKRERARRGPDEPGRRP